MSDYKGYPLFADVDDVALRRNNQSALLANMFEEHSKEGKVSAEGLRLITGYFSLIHPVDRRSVKDTLIEKLKERGLKHAS